MKIKLLYLLLFVTNISFAQSLDKKDSLQVYINKLDWSSFGITTNYFMDLYLKEDGKRIIAIHEPSKVNLLLQSFDDSTKTVAIHVLLTKIFESKKSHLGYLYNYKDSIIESTCYSYNGLSWVGKNDGTSTIERKAILTAKSYWVNKLKKKVHVKK